MGVKRPSLSFQLQLNSCVQAQDPQASDAALRLHCPAQQQHCRVTTEILQQVEIWFMH